MEDGITGSMCRRPRAEEAAICASDDDNICPSERRSCRRSQTEPCQSGHSTILPSIGQQSLLGEPDPGLAVQVHSALVEANAEKLLQTSCSCIAKHEDPETTPEVLPPPCADVSDQSPQSSQRSLSPLSKEASVTQHGDHIATNVASFASGSTDSSAPLFSVSLDGEVICTTSLGAASVGAATSGPTTQARSSLESKFKLLKRCSTRSSGLASTKNETMNLLEAGLRQVTGRPKLGSFRRSQTSSRELGDEDNGGFCARSTRNKRGSSDVREGRHTGHLVENSSEMDTHSNTLMRLLFQMGFAVVLGAFAGLTAVVFHMATGKIESWHQGAVRDLVGATDRDSSGNGKQKSVASLIGFLAVMAAGSTISAFLVNCLTQSILPELAGGGIIATKVCIAVGSPVPFRVGAARFVISALYAATGNAMGIEAPTLHICAAVASSMHAAACHVCERMEACLPNCPANALFNCDGLPQAVVLGCAAGLSAAFGSPLAAISYAVEEYVDVRQTGVVTALVLISAVSASLVNHGLQPHFGASAMSLSGARVATGVSDEVNKSSSIIPWLVVTIVIGIAMGSLSAFFVCAVMRVRGFTRGNSRRNAISGGLAGLLAGAIGGATFLLTGCSTSWGPGSLRAIYQADLSCTELQGVSPGREVCLILALVAGKLLAFGAGYASGGPGGTLMPCLFAGALLGRCAGLAAAPLDAALPDASMVLGMAALFSANMRLPLTAATITLEFATMHLVTYDTRVVLMIPLASALGTWTASWWDPFCIYERTMVQDGIDPLMLGDLIQEMILGQNAEDRSGTAGITNSHGGGDRSRGGSNRSGSVSSMRSMRSSGVGSRSSVAGPLMKPVRVVTSPVEHNSESQIGAMIEAAQKRSLVNLDVGLVPSHSNSQSALGVCDEGPHPTSSQPSHLASFAPVTQSPTEASSHSIWSGSRRSSRGSTAGPTPSPTSSPSPRFLAPPAPVLDRRSVVSSLQPPLPVPVPPPERDHSTADIRDMPQQNRKSFAFGVLGRRSLQRTCMHGSLEHGSPLPQSMLVTPNERPHPRLLGRGHAHRKVAHADARRGSQDAASTRREETPPADSENLRRTSTLRRFKELLPHFPRSQSIMRLSTADRDSSTVQHFSDVGPPVRACYSE